MDVKSLISKRFDVDHAFEAYEELENNKSVLGILIDYPNQNLSHKMQSSVTIYDKKSAQNKVKIDNVSVGFLGAGNYGANILAPAFQKAGVNLQSVMSSQGVSAKRLAKKCGFKSALTDDQMIYDDDKINTVVIATRHNAHADQVIRALEKNKHVFVEKPLAICLDDLAKIKFAYENKNNLLMIGFNRRFSPLIQTMKKLLSTEKMPKSFMMTVNAGAIPQTHWAQDIAVGGGRIIGEACHFIDLLRYLAGNP
ncbi:MAG: putative zinc-binding dehydrogenase, partial [uncultured bacterium]